MLVGGGVRCGKSAFALTRACQLGARRLFIATAQAFDAEMARRIADHQQERGALFETVEEPLALAEAVRAHAGRAHQRLARQSDELYLGALGCLLRLRPGPMTLVSELENEHVDRR